MRKNLLLLGVLAVLIIPLVLASQNDITNVSGNNSDLTFSLTTTQVTVNPTIDSNITYCTSINVTGGATWNLTSFNFNLPDNSTTSVSTDFNFTNSSGSSTIINGTFVKGDYNYVNFNNLDIYLNDSVNGTIFNVTFMLDEPIDKVKLSTSQSGRVYTETWNITSSATNLTITNASLVVTPTYWYTRIGNPTAVTFNGTTKDYLATYDNISVYTDLNLGTNMIEYGSGWSTLSLTYNGPTVDLSGGSSPSVAPVSVIPTEISAWFTPKGMFFVFGGLVILGGIITIAVVLLKKR